MLQMNLLIGVLLIVLSFNNEVMSQRSPYAGSRPSGYKDRFRPEITTTVTDVSNRFGGNDNTPLNGTQRPPMAGVPVVNGEATFIPLPTLPTIGNRIGENEIASGATSATSTTTARLPYDAYGDHQLVDHLNSLPYDKRPFWLINAQAIEAQRNSNQQNNFSPIASRSSFLG